MDKEELATECPTCKKRVVYRQGSEAPFFPFCSERCKLIDLGRWFDEEHRISEPLTEQQEQQDEGEPEGRR